MSHIQMLLAQHNLWRNIELIGVIYPSEMFTGVTATRARRPLHTRTLLEENNIKPDSYPNEGVERFIRRVDADLALMRHHRTGIVE